MMRIVFVGLNYKTAAIEIRERFSFSKESIDAGLAELFQKKSIEECLILSTCNRVEIYAVSVNAEKCVEEIKEFLSKFHGVPYESFSSYLQVSIGNAAANHILRVASSLDSMVIGEPQILGQVKEAYRVANQKRTTGLILNRLFHQVFSVAKRVRAETKIGTQAVSISYAAIQLAKRIFDDLSKRTVMLIGAGDMAELALKHLLATGIKDLIIASRTIESAESLARRHKGKAIRIEEVYYYLKDVDILITATDSMDFVIKPQHVREALQLRKNEPIFMIDIAVPRDIDPRIEEIPNIYLYDIDDLQSVLNENLQIRKKHAERAEEIVNEGEKKFQRWINGLKVVPAIISLKERFEDIKKAELEKAVRKFPELSENEKKIIETLAAGIIGKILYKPMTNLKKESSTALGALYVDTLKRLFELENSLEQSEEDDIKSNIKNWD